MIRAHYLMEEYGVDDDEGVTALPSRKKHPPLRAVHCSRPRRFACHPLPPRLAIRFLLLPLPTDDDPEVGLVQFQRAYKIVVVRQVVDRPQRQ